MKASRRILLLLWVATWQLPRCSLTLVPPPEKEVAEPEKILPPAEVISFLEVYSRSACQPKEMMVSVTAEHPSLANHVMFPSYVALKRCTGCCSDDSLDCVPSRSRELIMEVLASLFPYRYLNQLTFEEHLECVCRSRTTFFRSNSIGQSCAPCRDRKKQPDPHTCKCVCRHSARYCERRGMKFNEMTCRCMKHRRWTTRRRVKPTL